MLRQPFKNTRCLFNFSFDLFSYLTAQQRGQPGYHGVIQVYITGHHLVKLLPKLHLPHYQCKGHDTRVCVNLIHKENVNLYFLPSGHLNQIDLLNCRLVTMNCISQKGSNVVNKGR